MKISTGSCPSYIFGITSPHHCSVHTCSMKFTWTGVITMIIGGKPRFLNSSQTEGQTESIIIQINLDKHFSLYFFLCMFKKCETYIENDTSSLGMSMSSFLKANNYLY